MTAPTWLVLLVALLWVALIFALDSRDKWRARAERERRLPAANDAS